MPSSHRLQQLLLALIGAIGSAIFAFFLALTFHTPEWVETFAADFIEREAARQLDEKIDAFQPPTGEGTLSRVAASLYQKNEAEIERYRESLRLKVHEQMADAMAQIRDLDCECRARWAAWIQQDFIVQMGLLQQSNAALQEFIHATYARVVEALKRDLRIFTGANAALFLGLLAAAFLKPQAVLQLFVPGLLLTTATLICSYFYLFQQNWLLTILYNDYLGLTYLAYLGLVFGFLCDIVLNRARITTEVVNAVLSALGSAVSAVPC